MPMAENANIWRHWCDYSDGTTTRKMETVWKVWTSGTAASTYGTNTDDWANDTTATFANEIWGEWCNEWVCKKYTTASSNTATTYVTLTPKVEREPLTPEEEEARRLRQQEQAAQRAAQLEADRKAAAEIAEARKKANARARGLLTRWLTTEQVQDLERRSVVKVKGSAGGVYEVECGESIHHNVYELNEHGERVARLCFQIHGDRTCPPHDHHLAQVLALATDEPGARKVANRSVIPNAERAMPANREGIVMRPQPARRNQQAPALAGA